MATSEPIGSKFEPAIQPRRPAYPIAWVVAAGGVITAISLGVRSTFGLFLDPVIETIGTGRGPYALAIAVQNLVWGFSQPIAGAISDRFGAARTLAAGAALYVAALTLMSTASSSTTVLISAGFLTGLAVGAASFAVVLSSVGRMVSPERRSMTLGIVSALGSIGQFILVPLAQWRLSSGNWQNTVLLLAFVAAALVVFTPFLRGRASDFPTGGNEPDRPLRHDLRRAARHPSYLLLNVAFLVCGFHVTFIATHLPSYVGDLGQSEATASNALALVGLFNVFGSLAAGALGGRFSKTRLLAGIYALRALFIAAFIAVPQSPAVTIIFGAAIGLVWLATVPLTSAIVSQQFGTTHSGALFGLVFLSHQIGAFLGAWLGGELADRTDSYTVMWWIAIALAILATVVHLFMDDGPAEDRQVPAGGPVRLAGAGGVAVFVIALGFVVTGVAAALAPTRVGAEPRHGSPPMFFCPLGTTQY